MELRITNILEHLLSKLVTEQVVDHAQEMLGFSSRQALLDRLRNLMLQFKWQVDVDPILQLFHLINIAIVAGLDGVHLIIHLLRKILKSCHVSFLQIQGDIDVLNLSHLPTNLKGRLLRKVALVLANFDFIGEGVDHIIQILQLFIMPRELL